MKFLILSRLSTIYSTRRLVQEAEIRGHEVHVENPEISEAEADILIPRLGGFRYEESIASFEHLQKTSGAQAVLNAMPFFHQARHKMRAHEILGDLPQPALFENPTHFPLVIKDCLSSQGEGVFLCKNPQELSNCLFKLQGRDILFQEFIAESQGRDIRVFVIGDSVIASMQRQSANPLEEFRSNLSLGGAAHPVTLTEEEQNLCISAVRRLGLDYAGVDLIRSYRGGLILEVNPCPGLEGIEKWSQKNIAKEIVLYAESIYYSHSQR
jgi:ribosomal protein S6--L-glutamate ligase